MIAQDFTILTDARDQVGESPVWDEATQSLYWVDIIGKTIARFSRESEAIRRWHVDDFPTAIALRENRHDAVLALAGGVGFFNFDTQATDMFCTPDKVAGNRLNEGKCDPRGRFWVGSMQTNLNPDGSGREIDRHSGALFRVDPDGATSCHTDHEFGISNTMAWSPDRRRFYFGDSLRNVIFAFDYDDDSGQIENCRTLLENYNHGVPDGSCIDDDGCLWNARFGGERIVRITPDGRIDQEVELPVTNPTSCAFGGPNHDILFVTSAQFSLDDKQLAANPAEGAVVAFKPGVTGPSGTRFGG